MPSKIKADDGARKPAAEGQLLNTGEAARYLGVSRRWLEDNPDIPRVNIARPGSKRAMWRYPMSDLDAWVRQKRDSAEG